MPVAQRYVKISRGEWRIIFIRKAVPQIEPPSQEASSLIKRLTSHGVTPSVATELVRDYPQELIEMQTEVLERLQQAKERESIRNPAGYLVKSIRDGYAPPANLRPKKTPLKIAKEGKPEQPAPKDPAQVQIEAYLLSLSNVELDSLEHVGLEHAEAPLADGYRRSKQAGGPAFTVYRRMILEREAKRQLFSKLPPSKNAA
jgi:hypothetical protein